MFSGEDVFLLLLKVEIMAVPFLNIYPFENYVLKGV